MQQVCHEVAENNLLVLKAPTDIDRNKASLLCCMCKEKGYLFMNANIELIDSWPTQCTGCDEI
jgi:hypothetical protein